MTPKEFRTELTKIMPGYSWTVHKSSSDSRLEATGTQSSGFNRLSTLRVVRTERDGSVWYEAKSAGFGLRAPWLGENSDATLARALRGLQRHYEQKAATYAGHARALQNARQPKGDAS
ncbi:hypothetical protein MIC97_08880 [Aquamicrobium sp. NLF2-7]|uniref:hypothetical protein n=1 Tax=Aquamicrobium sp. NLF2-7 TaxID=2918753 RepID=UPI001EFAE0A2|nr:hypothetical protein [Aquamicrobium sp. NLF2-7]MCG8271615.1 hypothetical protein [Aquamicrobium sp. NLF2-7]